MMTLNKITDAILEYHPSADLDIILKAYLFSAKAHRGQSRKSGEAYLSHPLEVAYNLTKLKMDETAVSVGLLHDTIEDTMATPEEIQDLFGSEVLQLVDGVTKISRMGLGSLEEKQAENYRKLILAMAKDIRVILIKLADRAHNLKTLGSMTPEQKLKIARETMEIYAPLANRLGIGWLKAELENGAFKYLHPEEYTAIRKKVSQEEEQRRKYVEKVRSIISRELQDANIPEKVAGRPKHYYSIYKKMMDQQIDFRDVYDLIGVRVLTDTVKDCYAILGLIHSIWKPIPGKFKDYIAMPKPNMYQSLHTTVIGPEGQRVEVQIRTHEMHMVCEEGIAAHWQYKKGGSGQPAKMDEQLLWVRHLLESHKDSKNPKDFLELFKIDLYPHEVYVFTPQGEIIALPKDASPVDFAYQVHTDIGNHCLGAKVNGKLVPLKYKLKNGDRVEILTSKNKKPSRGWLDFIKTSKARSRIMNHINSEEKAANLHTGREVLEREIKKYDLNPSSVMKGKNFEAAIQACGFNSGDSLLVAIGMGKIMISSVIEKLIPKEKREEAAARVPSKEKPRATPIPKRRDSGVRVKSFEDNMLIRMGKCCTPVPGDEIVGYVTRGRGVSVHSVHCVSVRALDSQSERILEVEWDSANKATYPARISIVTEDRSGMLANISGVLADCDINITKATVNLGAHKRAYFDFSVEIYDLDHLNRTMDETRKIEGVIHVERIQERQKKQVGESKPEKDGKDLKPAGEKEILIKT